MCIFLAMLTYHATQLKEADGLKKNVETATASYKSGSDSARDLCRAALAARKTELELRLDGIVRLVPVRGDLLLRLLPFRSSSVSLELPLAGSVGLSHSL